MRPKHQAPDGEVFRQKAARIAVPQVPADAAVDVAGARQRRPTRSALYANRYMDTETTLNQLRNRRTVVEQRQGTAAHVGERLPRVDA